MDIFIFDTKECIRKDKFHRKFQLLPDSQSAPRQRKGILFLIYVSRLPELKAQISQFADNSALYYRSRSTQLIQNNLQSSLNILTHWCDFLKIKINPNKTQYKMFKNPSKKESELNLKIKGVPIGKTDSLKFLGITLTPHLRWNDHCNSLVMKANSRLFQLWRLSNLNINEESLLFVYKTWIRPLFLYSNACWTDQSQAIVIKIHYVQNKALRICLRKPRRYKVQKLHKEANMQMIRELQIKLANGYISLAIKHNMQSVIDLIHKKTTVPAKHLQKYSRPPSILTKMINWRTMDVRRRWKIKILSNDRTRIEPQRIPSFKIINRFPAKIDSRTEVSGKLGKIVNRNTKTKLGKKEVQIYFEIWAEKKTNIQNR